VALIGLTDVLAEALKDKVEAIEAEQLGHIVGASQRLNRLISDILVLSKSFSGASSLRVSNESMTDLLDDSIIGLEERQSQEHQVKSRGRARPDAALRPAAAPSHQNWSTTP
jgi:K+-sensing histidine kinase KdpD